jgi:hypothetical protein
MRPNATTLQHPTSRLSQTFSSSACNHLRVVHSQATFKCKDLLPLKPNTLWTIDKGVVRSLTWDEEGRIITLGFWGEGDVERVLKYPKTKRPDGSEAGLPRQSLIIKDYVEPLRS